MITLLEKIVLKNTEGDSPSELRRKYGMLFGGVGIFLNIVLFAIKLIAGIISGSVAIVADSLNNLSDCGSSIISLVGFKLAGQKPDTNHPFGHGRFEYISGLVISMLIILMGGELFITSIRKIFNATPIIYNNVVLIILIISIVVKLYMFYYNKSGAAKFKSSKMKATSMDSLSDSVTTLVVLISTLVAHFCGLKIDGFAGLIVSVFILYSGITSAKDTIDPLLGSKPDKEFVEKIANFVMSFEGIYGVHDLVVHDYGAGRMMISLHAEVPADGNIVALHDTIDNIEHKLQETLGCHATIHMDPVQVNDENTNRMKRLTTLIVKSIDESFTIHDFRMVYGQTHINLIFDVVVPYEVNMTEDEVKDAICSKVRSLPGNLYAVVDVDHPMC